MSRAFGADFPKYEPRLRRGFDQNTSRAFGADLLASPSFWGRVGGALKYHLKSFRGVGGGFGIEADLELRDLFGIGAVPDPGTRALPISLHPSPPAVAIPSQLSYPIPRARAARSHPT